MYKSRAIQVGNLKLGGDAPVRIQSMTNTPTGDVSATVDQCKSILSAGADLVRVTVRNLKEAESLASIKEKLSIEGFQEPLVADVHFNPEIAFRAALYADKVRINPGNFGGPEFRKSFLTFLDICRQNNTAIRIGINQGSLSDRIMNDFGDSPEGMVESAMEFLRICQQENFSRVVVSLKSSNTRTMIYANRLLVRKLLNENMDYPLHTGITEAGAGVDGRMKSAIGIGTLLAEGIGDTIRVSLTEKPENEIPFARKLASISAIKKSSSKEEPSSLPLAYSRRRSNPVLNIGGHNPPVVIVSNDQEQLSSSGQSRINPDFFYGNHSGILFPGNAYHTTERISQIPVIQTKDLIQKGFPESKSVCINLLPDDLKDLIIRSLIKNDNAILAINVNSNDHSLGIRKLFDEFSSSQWSPPVILKYFSVEKDRMDYLMHAALDLGGLLIDGLPDGIWLENNCFPPADNVAMAFNLLQASRSRMSKTEYIACPSCGRTLFHIENVLAKVMEATKHLKHLKIAVMGCIVNGPGEMADADYGYVGSGPGKITLYRSRDPVKKNIPEEKAIEELIHLIRDNNDWIDPD